MSDSETLAAALAASGRQEAAQQQPPMMILTQYVKDLSFENPNSPVIFGQTQTSPKIAVSVDVRVNRIQERLAEVILALKVEAQVAEKAAFLIELDYAGIANLTVEKTREEAKRAFLIDAPQMLFPFARAIVATLIRDGGFMPFLLTPIDFEHLYRQRKAAVESAAIPAAGPAGEA
ncbi:MAG: protein-export chaperone SecB [Rhodospirillales bacterium]|nr:protein-export chaperone SecB [Rhodospirillales bacterium]